MLVCNTCWENVRSQVGIPTPTQKPSVATYMPVTTTLSRAETEGYLELANSRFSERSCLKVIRQGNSRTPDILPWLTNTHKHTHTYTDVHMYIHTTHTSIIYTHFHTEKNYIYGVVSRVV